jgi:hypothetical protein
LSEQIDVFEQMLNSQWFMEENVFSFSLVLAHGDLLQQYLPNMTLSEIQNLPHMSQFNDQISVKKIAEFIVETCNAVQLVGTLFTYMFIYSTTSLPKDFLKC